MSDLLTFGLGGSSNQNAGVGVGDVEFSSEGIEYNFSEESKNFIFLEHKEYDVVFNKDNIVCHTFTNKSKTYIITKERQDSFEFYLNKTNLTFSQNIKSYTFKED